MYNRTYNLDMNIIFEWDENKRQKTLKARGLDFMDAQHVFTKDAFIVKAADKYPETRYILIGPLFTRIVVIVFCKRVKKVRIISMRKANKREVKKYYEKSKEE